MELSIFALSALRYFMNLIKHDSGCICFILFLTFTKPTKLTADEFLNLQICKDRKNRRKVTDKQYQKNISVKCWKIDG